MVVAFNSGINGDDSLTKCGNTWAPAARAALKHGCPFVFTSYSKLEATLDVEAIQNIEPSAKILVGPEPNPFRSPAAMTDWAMESEEELVYVNSFVTVASCK